MTIKETRSTKIVASRAIWRAAGSNTSVISQKISSASRADKAIVVENVIAAARSHANFAALFSFDPERVGERRPWEGLEYSLGLGVPPDSSGKSFRHATKATIRKVKKKGARAIAALVGLIWLWMARRA